MTRKTKIRITVAAVMTGALLIACWPHEDEGQVTLAYAGVSSVDSNLVFFTASNSSKVQRHCSITTQEHSLQNWVDRLGVHLDPLAGGGTTNFTLAVPGTNRWRVFLSYPEPLPDNIFTHGRLRLWAFLDTHGWPRSAQWVLPSQPWKETYGLEMLGNQPVRLSKKS